jgi:hypothetical protein
VALSGVKRDWATNHQKALDANEIVYDVYRHSKKLMHESGLVMQADYVGKTEDLYLWSLLWQSKTCFEIERPMRLSCGCNTGLLIKETRQTLTLKKVRAHDQDNHAVRMTNASKSLGVKFYSGSDS